MAKILITGGAGFIGLHLARSLSEDGNDVVLAENFQRGVEDEEVRTLLKNKKVQLLRMDVTKESEFSILGKGYSQVYHFAAINGTSNFYKKPDDVIRVGAVGTINALEWFTRTNKQGKFLLASSSETYAGTAKLLGEKFKLPTPEKIALAIEEPSNPRWSYAASKILGEVACFNYAAARNMDFAIARYHNIYGPRMGHDHVIPQFIYRILKKENPFKIYGGKESRAFCYISDAVEATKLVMAKSGENRVMNIGRSDSEIRIAELAKELFTVANYTAELSIEQAPQGATQRRCPDTNLLLSMGFRPKVSLREGLSKTFEWYAQSFYNNPKKPAA